MKGERAITIIALIITIIVIIIIAGVTTYSGIESINTAKKTAFISELEMIQAKVNTIYEKRRTNQSEVEYYNKIGQDINNVEQNKLELVLVDNSKEGFRYFSRKRLKITRFR